MTSYVRVVEGGRPWANLKPGQWYPVVRKTWRGLWIDLGNGDPPVLVEHMYLDELGEKLEWKHASLKPGRP